MKNALYFVLGLFVLGCAQVVAPSGGPKDTQPPKIIESIPKNYSTNIYTKTITLTFNEYVLERNLNTELLISPPLKKLPKTYFKGKTFFMSFTDTLLENTTYQFNFGKGLVDLNEANPLDSSLLVFSTGDYLDSLQISGKVIDAITLEPKEAQLVMLYKNLSDSVPCKEKPYYYTRTNKEGEFNLNFLAVNGYQLFVLDDKNSNFLFDLPNEAIGFLSENINLVTDTQLTILQFEETNLQQALKSLSMVNPYNLQAIFNLPAKNIELIPTQKHFKKAWYFLQDTVANDTLNFWIPEPFVLDTLELEVYEQGEILDTTEILFPKAESEKKPIQFKVNFLEASSGVPYFGNLTVRANLPFTKIDTNKIFLFEDSVLVESSIEFIENKVSFSVNYSWNPEKGYYILMEDSSLFSFNQKTNSDTLIQSFEISDKSSFGDIEVNLLDVDSLKSVVLELKNESGSQVFQSQKGIGSNSFKFNNVGLGSYKLWVTFDEDNNGKFTPGKYGSKLQPERKFIYPSAVNVQANFNTQINWSFGLLMQQANE